MSLKYTHNAQKQIHNSNTTYPCSKSLNENMLCGSHVTTCHVKPADYFNL